VADVRRRAGASLRRRAVAIAAVGLLAGSGGGSSPAALSSPGAARSPSGSVTGTPLSAGLLPADAFGPHATVLNLTLDQLRRATASAGATSSGGRVDPPSCAVAVQGGSPDFTGVADLAAQSAVGPDGSTVEALLTGAPVQEAVDRVLGAVAACPQATVTAPDGTTSTITFRSVTVPPMGDDAAAMAVTTSVSGPGAAQPSPALVGVVRDHDRLLLLLAAGAQGAAPDEARFTALLQQAYRAQARALD
jgi:hypothetical protein